MKRISASIAVLTALAGTGPALADSYGAITYSPSTGALGWPNANDNRGDAETVARRNCDSSADDCRIAIWFRNGCSAVAVGHRGGVRRSAAVDVRPEPAVSSAGNVPAASDPERARASQSRHAARTDNLRLSPVRTGKRE